MLNSHLLCEKTAKKKIKGKSKMKQEKKPTRKISNKNNSYIVGCRLVHCYGQIQNLEKKDHQLRSII